MSGNRFITAVGTINAVLKKHGLYIRAVSGAYGGSPSLYIVDNETGESMPYIEATLKARGGKFDVPTDESES